MLTRLKSYFFSVKRQCPSHPSLRLKNEEVTSKTEHKHLGMILDSKLSFKSHVNEAILKAKRGIGLISHLSQYVSRDVLDQMYKLYVRPHLDYGDIVYHKYDPDLSSVITRRLEQTQYAASLAVTGAWRGTSRQKLYDELGWESLYERRWYRRLCHCFKLKVTQYPAYLFSLIPPKRQISYDLRNPQAYAQNRARTDRFSTSYFYNTLHEWNKLPTEICSSKSLAEFKRKLIALIRPVKKTIYGVTDLKGIRNITMLHVKFNDLIMRINFVTILSVLGLYVIVVRLMRTTSNISCIALILIHCVKISLALSQKCWVLISQTWIQKLCATCFFMGVPT